ncbi:MAG: DUF2752 domain-containing protein [Abitibacteriaceae bacterium]|nr:DUF2752 domain-containing protein [Abditibacteriaceae bacterium]
MSDFPSHLPSRQPLSLLDRLLPSSIAPGILLIACLLPPPHNGTIAGLPSFCMFYRLTGLPCPGCGMTRAVVCCAHGLWSEAVFYHPLGPLFFMALVGIALAPLIRSLWPRHPFKLAVGTKRWFYQGITYVGAFLLLTVWTLRLKGMLPGP